MDTKIFTTPSNKKLELAICSSNYHVELVPSDLGIYDRIVIQDLIKEIAQTQQIDANSKFPFKGIYFIKFIKVVVFHEAHLLSKDAQQSLRRTMEKYMGNLRVILCSNSTSQILGPIRSRCLLIRVPAPSVDEISKVLSTISLQENINLPKSFCLKIAETSDGNLRRAILMLEAAKVHQYPFLENQQVQLTDWEMFIDDIATAIMEEQSPQRYLFIK